MGVVKSLRKNKRIVGPPANLVPEEMIQNKIYLIRGRRVMFDADLARLYGVETEHLKRQVRRNQDRFPDDFLLILTREEFINLIRHFGGTSWGGTRKLPFAFTEHGILMLSSVLKSKRATQINIQIMRVFVKLKEYLLSHKDLARKIEALERKYKDHDKKITLVFEAIKQLLRETGESSKPKKPIGFNP